MIRAMINDQRGSCGRKKELLVAGKIFGAIIMERTLMIKTVTPLIKYFMTVL